MKDLQTGQHGVSTDSAGNQANERSSYPALSVDGRFVAFTSLASNLVAGDSNNATDVFVKDLQTGQITRAGTDNAAARPTALCWLPH